MQYQVTGSSAFAVIDLRLEQGDSIVAQPKSMVCMTTGIEINAVLGGVTGSGGFGGSVKGLMAGENIALTVYSANKSDQQITLAPENTGSVLSIKLESDSDLLIAKGSYLASEGTVSLRTEFTGVKGMLAQKGIFLVRATGPGALFLAAFGEIREKVLAPEERFVVDNDFVVAFDSSVQYQLVTAAKGLGTSFLSGEGLVNRYTGPGKVYYQTRAKQKTGFFGTIINTIR